MHGVVASERRGERQLGRPVDDPGIEVDHLELRPEAVEQAARGPVVLLADPVDAERPAQRGGGLYVQQS